MTVPVIRDFLHAHVLATSMVFLLWKYGRGGPVGLRVSSWGENRMLRRLMRGFGEVHTVIWFDEEEARGGMRSVKIVSFGMFAWAVRCGILGEGDLCMHLGKVGALLYKLVRLCHGPSLVDVNVTAYIRCVVCSLCVCL